MASKVAQSCEFSIEVRRDEASAKDINKKCSFEGTLRFNLAPSCVMVRFKSEFETQEEERGKRQRFSLIVV